MPTLTASATILVAAATVTEASTMVEITAAINGPDGRGRIVHPTLGTYDYEAMPDSWSGFGEQLDVVPLIQSQITLGGAAHTIWGGTVQDADRKEIWDPGLGLSMSREQAETLLAFYSQPPNPRVGQYIEWYPNYVTQLGYKVIMTGFTIGGDAVSRDIYTLQEWMTGAVVVTWRVVGFV